MSTIQPGQRVQLIGSKLIGTTRDKWTAKKNGQTITKFNVKWDTGQLGTVSEDDIEPFVMRSYKTQNA